jgi:hypothetical protein
VLRDLNSSGKDIFCDRSLQQIISSKQEIQPSLDGTQSEAGAAFDPEVSESKDFCTDDELIIFARRLDANGHGTGGIISRT